MLKGICLFLMISYAKCVCMPEEYECLYFDRKYFCSFNEDCFDNLELHLNPPPSFPPESPPSFPPSVPSFFNDCDLCFEHVRNEFASGF